MQMKASSADCEKFRTVKESEKNIVFVCNRFPKVVKIRCITLHKITYFYNLFIHLHLHFSGCHFEFSISFFLLYIFFDCILLPLKSGKKLLRCLHVCSGIHVTPLIHVGK